MKKSITEEKTPSEIHKDHRSRRKTSYLHSGLGSFSDVEKLEFILFYAINQKDTNPIAHRLLDTFGSFRNVLEAPIEALASVKGMGLHSAILINLIYQSMHAYASSYNLSSINKVSEAKKFVEGALFGRSQEDFIIICLSESNKILNTKIITSESTKRVDLSHSNLILFALNSHASKIIIGHNHPNGTPCPSDEDLLFTSNAYMNFLINDIVLLDHIIISPVGNFSFLHNKLIDTIKDDTIPKIRGNKKAQTLLKQPETSYIDDDVD